ncbi:MAG: ATP-binding protein [Pseudomonadota bacterium]
MSEPKDLVSDPENPLARQLKWLMFFRVVTATFLLAATVLVQYRSPQHASEQALPALYGLICLIYFVTFLFALVLPRLAGEVLQAHIQITTDVLVTTGIIYLTGGLESIFSFLYLLHIINAGLLIKIRGAILTASLSAILYGGLLDLHYYRYIAPLQTKYSFLDHYQATDILNRILVNMGAFFLVGVLAGYLSKQSEETKRKLAESRSDVERLEDLNESIIQSIDAGLATLGPGGEIVSFNPAAEAITGLTLAQVKGLHHRLVFPQLALPDETGGPGGVAVSWNWTYVRRDGEKFNLEVDLLGLMDRARRPWGRLLVFKDRTRLRRMEEDVARIEKLAAIGELAAGIAHEIRNPLASISGSFQMLENNFQPEGAQGRLIAIIRRELERLNQIVNDFLLFARPRPGERMEMDLSKTVEDNLRIFQGQAGLEPLLAIGSRIAPGLRVLFDRHQMEQVMWNLLRNAIEAMPGGGRLTVRVEVDPEDRRMALVSVADTGPGIPLENRTKIFDPFFTTKEGGVGLGLAIVSRILENGGGRIEIGFPPGQGTIFKVRVPLALP